MTFSEDQKVIKQFVPQRSDEALNVGLHVMRSNGRSYGFRPLPA